MVFKMTGCSKFSFPKSANRGVSRGTSSESGGVATLMGGGGAAAVDIEATFRGIAFVVICFFPLYGLLRMADLFVSMVNVVRRVLRDVLRLKGASEIMKICR